MPIKLKCFLPALVLYISGTNVISRPQVKRMVTTESTIVVGNRSTDSTGTVTISNAEIQSKIINVVPMLSGMAITADQPYIMVTPITAYIIFKTTNLNKEQLNIAIELAVNNTTLSFGSTNGREVHVCKANAGCTGCAFILIGKRIMTCNCDQNPGASQTVPGCQHSATWLH